MDTLQNKQMSTYKSRLVDIGWVSIARRMLTEIEITPANARLDLKKMWYNVIDLADDVSRVEVYERNRKMHSRLADEKLERLQEGIQNLEHMLLIARLTFGEEPKQ
jgi:hypothetical protein